MQKTSIILKCVGFKKFLAFGKEDHSRKKRYHYQCTTPRDLGEIQLFRKFQIFADGGPRRKTEKFWQIEKIIGDLYELDNFERKIFLEKKISKFEVANVIF